MFMALMQQCLSYCAEGSVSQLVTWLCSALTTPAQTGRKLRCRRASCSCFEIGSVWTGLLTQSTPEHPDDHLNATI